ncbi:regulatory protein RecX [Heliorestis acidaminivorans]|uniref:Regulatory protein RecX n=1 Tax=Heliorestis acidaminivorans TaxID=553427 RepID=A0A6I0F356_9FIRM|nr:regulatory protein RecX [Heliorestis acidaminivorans]KAB2954170.1 regulatory protein RecX [Heliorestis acidaminivorans]
MNSFTMKYLSYEESWKKALFWLSRRSLSSLEVAQRLQRKGTKEEDINAILDRLKELGYLNDQRFAYSFARYRKDCSSYGSLRIQQELNRRGIASNIVERAIEETLSAEEEYERAKKVALSKLQELSKKEKSHKSARLGRHLQQKGFPLELIYRLIEELKSEELLMNDQKT